MIHYIIGAMMASLTLAIRSQRRFISSLLFPLRIFASASLFLHPFSPIKHISNYVIPAAHALTDNSKDLETCTEVCLKQLLHLQPCSALEPPEESHNV